MYLCIGKDGIDVVIRHLEGLTSSVAVLSCTIISHRRLAMDASLHVMSATKSPFVWWDGVMQLHARSIKTGGVSIPAGTYPYQPLGLQHKPLQLSPYTSF